MISRLRERGASFAVLSALLLGLVVAANLYAADVASGSLSRGAGERVDAEPRIYYVHVDAMPGDLVWMNSGWLAGLPVELYVVEGGEAFAFWRNETPRHVYAHVPPPEPSPTGYGVTRIGLVRPPVPDDMPAPREGEPVGWFGSGLDFVWVLRPDAAERASLVNGTIERMREGPDEHTLLEFKVTRAWMADAQPFFYALEGLALVGVVAGGALWLGRPRARETDEARGEVAGALALARRAEVWLRTLRDILLAVGMGILLGGFFLVAGMESLVRKLYFTSLDLRWSLHMQWATALVWIVLFVAWLLAFVGVHRELRRWRRMQAAQPRLE